MRLPLMSVMSLLCCLHGLTTADHLSRHRALPTTTDPATGWGEADAPDTPEAPEAPEAGPVAPDHQTHRGRPGHRAGTARRRGRVVSTEEDEMDYSMEEEESVGGRAGDQAGAATGTGTRAAGGGGGHHQLDDVPLQDAPVVRADGARVVRGDDAPTTSAGGGGGGGGSEGGGGGGDPDGSGGPLHEEPLDEVDNCTRPIECYREADRLRRIETIKRDILSKLRMAHPPNMTNMKAYPNIPQISSLQSTFHLNVDSPGSSYQNDMERDEDDYHARTLKVINFAKPLPEEWGSADPSFCYFTFQPEVRQSIILNAQLGLYIRDQNLPPQDVVINVYRVNARGRSGREPLRSKTIRLNAASTNKWYNFNITKLVNKWLEYNSTNRGLKIEARASNGDSVVVVTPTTDEDKSYRPYLGVEVREDSGSRPRRMASQDCDAQSHEDLCCRYELEVDFESFGWDWIIAPKRYFAYYCSGECPFGYMPQYHVTQLQQQAPTRRRGSGPCCSPSKMSAISMLYFDSSTSVVACVLPRMVVNKCGCA